MSDVKFKCSCGRIVRIPSWAVDEAIIIRCPRCNEVIETAKKNVTRILKSK